MACVQTRLSNLVLTILFYFMFVVYYSVQRVRMFYNDKSEIVNDCKAVLQRARKLGIM